MKFNIHTLIILSLMCIFNFNVLCQKQNNIWYFGNKLGISFNTSPPTILTNNQFNIEEGSSVFSDANGDLLFYTNGNSILNARHLPIRNGSNLLGSTNSTNNAIIIPLPNNDSLFYVFTIGAAAELGKGLRFSVINKKGDNGNGEVTDKNILLLNETYEKIAVTHHCNGVDFWIVVHEYNSNKYYSYLLTNAGVNASPVISFGDINITANESNTIGSLRFSVDGKKIAAAHSYENNVVELCSFNNITGVLSSPLLIRTSPYGTPNFYTGVYAVEFSSSGNLLYVSENIEADGDGKLFQFDIQSNNQTTINNSKKIIATNVNSLSGGLQLASDGKIYHCVSRKEYLACINKPNVYGLGCEYINEAIFFGTGTSSKFRFGLPTLAQSFFDPSIIFHTFDINSRLCSDNNVVFTLNTALGIDSVKWDFGDNNYSTNNNPTHIYAAEDLFTVTLNVFSTRCGVVRKEIISKKIWIKTVADFLGPDKSFCDFTSTSIVPILSFSDADYLWSTNEKTPSIDANTLGKYWLTLTYNKCEITDTIELKSKEKQKVKIIGENSVCSTKPITLKTNIDNANFYEWSTGEKTSFIKITKPGLYKVTVTNDCVMEDSALINIGDCDFFIPNSFSPNNDGKNDLFGPINEFNATNYRLQIFDRWSNKIFVTNNLIKKWDGTHKGKQMPMGNYLWIVEYTTKRGVKKYEQGTVILIR